jgi:hypothetical protein
LAVPMMIPIIAASSAALAGYSLYRNACLIGRLVQFCFQIVGDLE